MQNKKIHSNSSKTLDLNSENMYNKIYYIFYICI